jgi:hypothetical protein
VNTPAAADPGLVIYTRRDCSLCVEMEARAREVIGLEARIAVVEIDDDPALLRRFGPDIPVLCIADEVVCKHFLDPGRLLAALGSGS